MDTYGVERATQSDGMPLGGLGLASVLYRTFTMSLDSGVVTRFKKQVNLLFSGLVLFLFPDIIGVINCSFV